MKTKYHSKRITIDGEQYDSVKEYRRWCELKLMQKAGLVRSLKRQVKFVLIPTQRNEKGKCIERECAYFADFTYTDSKTGQYIVEDAKGYRTPEYKIKRKLMLSIHGIRITET